MHMSMSLVAGASSASQGFLLACATLVLLVFALLVTTSGIALWRALMRWSCRHSVAAQRLETGFWVVFGAVGFVVTYALASKR